MTDRYRTILKKFYITPSQNDGLEMLIQRTGLGNFSRYARTFLFKESPVFLTFDEEAFHDFIFAIKRIKNNLQQLKRISNQSGDSDGEKAFQYCITLLTNYEIKMTQQVNKSIERLRKKMR